MKKKGPKLVSPPAFLFGVGKDGGLCAQRLPPGWVCRNITWGHQLLDDVQFPANCLTIVCGHAEHGGAYVSVTWVGLNGEGGILLDDISTSADDTFSMVTKAVNKFFRVNRRE